MARVSVVIPTWNRVGLLEGAIDSARAAGGDVEIIVVDDASTDGTARYCRTLDGIRYVRLDENAGQGRARNRGIEAATADFVAFLDDDDRRLPGSLDVQIERLLNDPSAALCYGPLLAADQRGQVTGDLFLDGRCPEGDLFWELLETPFIPLSSVVARKTCLIEAGGFSGPLSASAGEDWELWMRLAERHPFVAVRQAVGIYRVPTADSGQTSSDMIRLWCDLAHAQGLGLALPRARAGDRRVRRALRRRLVNRAVDRLFLAALRTLSTGRRDDAARAIYHVLRLKPSGVIHVRTFWRVFRAWVSTFGGARAEAAGRTST